MMKKYIALAIALAFAPAFSQEADAPKPDGAPKAESSRQERIAASKAEMLKKYDKDGDGQLSDEERKAMQADRPARGEGGKARRTEMLKKYDKDGDGQLSDEERKAMRADRPSRGEGRGPRGASPDKAE